MKENRVDTSNKKRFVTIFPNIENIHLMKDVGMYPFAMYSYCGYDSGVVVNKRLDYPYLSSEVRGLKKFNAPSIFSNHEVNCILWLLFNARKIDVLNLFHQVKHTRISIALYKRLNKKGKVYVHLDCDGTEYENYQLGLEGNSIKRRVKRFIYYHIFYPKRIRKDVFWGGQNKLAVKNIVGKFPYEKVKYMPNGYYSKYNRKVEFADKENIILTVGRIGTQQKRTDLLIQGFIEASPYIEKSWRLEIVGPIENHFESQIKKIYMKNPELQDRIIFTGAVYNRVELAEKYRRAKLFTLTSDYESFGIVLVEAMSQGCTLLTSNFPASYDLIDNEKNGKVFSIGNIKEFVDKLIDIANDDNYMEECCLNGQQFARENYDYLNIAKRLDKWIYNLEE